MIMSSLIFSYLYGTLLPSVMHLFAMMAYNEGGMARFWYMKSCLGAIGYMCYCMGTVTILGENNHWMQVTKQFKLMGVHRLPLSLRQLA